MTRRRLLCGLLLASAVLACFAGWLLVIASGPRVTRSRFEQVKKGMSREEVIRTVGGPPGNYSLRGTDSRGLPMPTHRSIDPKHYENWLCDDGRVLVFFDDADRVDEVMFYDRSPPTLAERIRHWLGL
jgi:hypothetical protein